MEKVPVHIYKDFQQASRTVAKRIAALIRARSKEGKKEVVLGLATGLTPIGVYDELIRMHKVEQLDFSKVITFNLDEYWPMDPDSIHSYKKWMHVNFFRHINIKNENIHIPSGQVSEEMLDEHCRQYEELIDKCGGIDLQILGIGKSGHIGFNEPGSAKDSITRRVRLDKITRKDAAGDFFGEQNVPKMAITMGIKTILKAKEIVLLAFGEHKAQIIKMAVEGDVSSEVSASYLQEHPNVAIYLNASSAAELTRMKTPWVSGSCVWDEPLERKAAIWLSQKSCKPILKLTDEDYSENYLADLTRLRGQAYDINLRVFKKMMNTITGWPGGKECQKKVLILSPHPDDDVICMAGTMSRLVEQRHEVHVAYMVSGYLSVFDHNALRHAEFVKDFNRIFGLTHEQTEHIEKHIETFLKNKKPGDIDTPEVCEIKSLIRKSEAISAAKYCGVSEQNIHFLDLPFYRKKVIEKANITNDDVEIVQSLIERVDPDMIFAAGDMSDPHGTHRLCFNSFIRAYENYSSSQNKETEILLYRGAWQEWPPEQIDMAVPLSPDELKRKRFAIFRHESQKDKAMFPGPYDEREFWQRAEERSMSAASVYNALGLPEYHAMEVFVRWPVNIPLYLNTIFEPS